MIDNTFEDAFDAEWVKRNITNPTNELVILREIIPWQKIINRLTKFYSASEGAIGKSIRAVVALMIIGKLRGLSDRNIFTQLEENRYIQYFCNVPDEQCRNYMDPSSMSKLRARYGVKGIVIIEVEVFKLLRKVGIIDGNSMLIDSTVLVNKILYPTDISLLYKALNKMALFAKQYNIPLWWDESEVKKVWRAYNLNRKEKTIADFFFELFVIFFDALSVFDEIVESLVSSDKRKEKAVELLEQLKKFDCQNFQKLAGETHIDDRIVSFDEPDSRPIVKGKKHPKCEFGTTLEITFNRDGFMITAENYIGNPSDKKLYANTLESFIDKIKQVPEAVISDGGFRSGANLKNRKDMIQNIFLGSSSDVSEEKREYCQKARSATEGFIAVAKNLRGFGCSLYRGLNGDKIWTSLCQAAYNLKKFIQLYREEKIDEKCLVKLGLLS